MPSVQTGLPLPSRISFFHVSSTSFTTLSGIVTFNIADAALDPLHIRRHAFVAFAAYTRRPGYGSGVAYLLFPLRANPGKVMRENKSRAGTVRTRHYRNLRLGKLNAGI